MNVLERVARALCRADGFDPDSKYIGKQREDGKINLYSPGWERWSGRALVALAAAADEEGAMEQERETLEDAVAEIDRMRGR
jgi:hypothetical protein